MTDLAEFNTVLSVIFSVGYMIGALRLACSPPPGKGAPRSPDRHPPRNRFTRGGLALLFFHLSTVNINCGSPPAAVICERPSMYRERAARMFSPEVYAVSFAIIELFWVAVQCLTAIPIIYFMVGCRLPSTRAPPVAVLRASKDIQLAFSVVSHVSLLATSHHHVATQVGFEAAAEKYFTFLVFCWLIAYLSTALGLVLATFAPTYDVAAVRLRATQGAPTTPRSFASAVVPADTLMSMACVSTSCPAPLYHAERDALRVHGCLPLGRVLPAHSRYASVLVRRFACRVAVCCGETRLRGSFVHRCRVLTALFAGFPSHAPGTNGRYWATKLDPLQYFIAALIPSQLASPPGCSQLALGSYPLPGEKYCPYILYYDVKNGGVPKLGDVELYVKYAYGFSTEDTWANWGYMVRVVVVVVLFCLLLCCMRPAGGGRSGGTCDASYYLARRLLSRCVSLAAVLFCGGVPADQYREHPLQGVQQ